MMAPLNIRYEKMDALVKMGLVWDEQLDRPDNCLFHGIDGILLDKDCFSHDLGMFGRAVAEYSRRFGPIDEPVPRADPEKW